MKDYKLIISSILIIISFFIGFTFNKQKYKEKLENLKEKKDYINIQIKNQNINIDNPNKNIIILVNGKESNSGVIDMK